MHDSYFSCQAERTKLEEEISLTNASRLHPPLDETALIQELVAQFLTHAGYVETARAFSGELEAESRALQNGENSRFRDFGAEEDLDAVNRQSRSWFRNSLDEHRFDGRSIGIRVAILDGDVDKALKHTNAYYSHVLQDRPQIYFRLRCRKFIEMIWRCSELNTGSSEKRGSATNGHSGDLYEDVFEPDMELDDHLNGHDDWDQMETEEADNTMKYHTLLQETLEYGQELQLEFREDGRREVKKALEETFSLLAYEDPKTSVVAHLLEPSGRVPVAEELNSAILGITSPSPFIDPNGVLTCSSVTRQVLLRRNRASVPADGSPHQRYQRRRRRRDVHQCSWRFPDLSFLTSGFLFSKGAKIQDCLREISTQFVRHIVGLVMHHG
jgi:hypothetical protein